ncbi:DUF2510 domain-containing protein [Nocardia sp. CS682]|uniref:DUF2510 domain-containing protein n=1 Tax=Nocardia sp. CS682 TaxID=1047172 RepID=UPI00197D7940|nr:DUF2510 domain-containing protein [Nocardia sp. CS682]
MSQRQPLPPGFETPAQTWTRVGLWAGIPIAVFAVIGLLSHGHTGVFGLLLLLLLPVALVVLVVVALVRVASKPRSVVVHAVPPMPARQAPPPGWYPDQFGTQRWWDGQQFTQATQ